MRRTRQRKDKRSLRCVTRLKTQARGLDRCKGNTRRAASLYTTTHIEPQRKRYEDQMYGGSLRTQLPHTCVLACGRKAHVVRTRAESSRCLDGCVCSKVYAGMLYISMVWAATEYSTIRVMLCTAVPKTRPYNGPHFLIKSLSPDCRVTNFL